MSDSANDYRQFQVHHAGTEPGLSGSKTSRVNLYFDAVPTHEFMMYLERMVTALKIQGIIGVVQVHDRDIEHAKAQLIIDNRVIVSSAASMWIEALNALISKQPDHFFRRLSGDETFRDAVATPSRSAAGVTSSTAVED